VAIKAWEELHIELMKEAKRYKPALLPEQEAPVGLPKQDMIEILAKPEEVAVLPEADEIAIPLKSDEVADLLESEEIIVPLELEEIPDETEPVCEVGLPETMEATETVETAEAVETAEEVEESEEPEALEEPEEPEALEEPETLEESEAAEPVAEKAVSKQPVHKPVKKYRLLTILSDILFYAAILVVLFSAITSKPADGAPKTAMGYSYFTVLTTSMQSEIPKGSFILVREIDPLDLIVGDNITFMRSDSVPVTHKIIDIYDNYEGSGERWFQTMGVNNINPDKDLVHEDAVLGKVKLVLPGLGAVISYMNSNIILVCIIYGLCVLLSFCFRGLFKNSGKKKLTVSTIPGEAAAS
jgi:signal peptidase